MIPSVPGRNQPKIDCMFFPATHGDVVELDPEDMHVSPRIPTRLPTGVRTSNASSTTGMSIRQSRVGTRAGSRVDTGRSEGASIYR